MMPIKDEQLHFTALSLSRKEREREEKGTKRKGEEREEGVEREVAVELFRLPPRILSKNHMEHALEANHLWPGRQRKRQRQRDSTDRTAAVEPQEMPMI